MKQLRWRQAVLTACIGLLPLGLWSANKEVELKSGERILGKEHPLLMPGITPALRF